MGRDLSATSKLSVSDAGKCLERLERGHWLYKSDDGYYELGVRTELQRRCMIDDSNRLARMAHCCCMVTACVRMLPRQTSRRTRRRRATSEERRDASGIRQHGAHARTR